LPNVAGVVVFLDDHLVGGFLVDRIDLHGDDGLL
jgi:hypothetical protein